MSWERCCWPSVSKVKGCAVGSFTHRHQPQSKHPCIFCLPILGHIGNFLSLRTSLPLPAALYAIASDFVIIKKFLLPVLNFFLPGIQFRFEPSPGFFFGKKKNWMSLIQHKQIRYVTGLFGHPYRFRFFLFSERTGFIRHLKMRK